ncbi:MAG: response regulator [Desulfobulbaceae bacterium]|nr:response regulator [Desulfobulbaceae bacterium]
MRESQQTVLALLRAGTAYHNSTLSIDWGDRQGLLHLRDGTIVAAEAEPLSGNGAALEIVRWQGFSLSEIDAEPVIKKNVTLSLEEIEHLFERYSIGGSPVSSFDDLATLDRAVLLIHQFRYSEAGKLLAELLKHNRFNYLGWLWYSRLLKNLDSIKKALSEAQKWGDHDPTVWLEVKKTGFGLANSDGGEIKRCFYCWTPLNVNESRCCYCRALQSIGKKSPATDLKKSELINGINRYISAFKEERENGKIGYALALGFFNLAHYQKSYKYLKYINSLAPGKALFRKSLEMLLPFWPTVQQPSIPPASQPIPAPSPAVQRTVVRGEGPLILVVEDSPTARKVINVVLKREGFGVVEAGSGEEAIAAAETINPSLILLDVMLPDTTGFDLLPRLRDFAHLVEIPVIMLTGRKGSMDKMKGLMAGSTEYLTKPFDPQKLTNAIRKYI